MWVREPHWVIVGEGPINHNGHISVMTRGGGQVGVETPAIRSEDSHIPQGYDKRHQGMQTTMQLP